MEIREVKDFIYENNKLEFILTELGMHHIKWHDNNSYITCGMPDGDNPQSTTVYNNSTLNVVAYTRNIVDAYGVSDIVSLVCFIKGLYFSNANQWLCQQLGLDYYCKPKPKDKMIQQLQNLFAIRKKSETAEPPLEPLPENTLIQYEKCAFTQFLKDNISIETQMEFELGLDLTTAVYNREGDEVNGFPLHRIAIPIRDENGTLVGVKGRILKNCYWGHKCVDEESDKKEPKYIYLYPCAKSQILYGLYKTYPFIKQEGEVIVCESEKGVMQLWSYGYKNAVAIGGHQLSKVQKEKIIRLGVNVIFAYDKDVQQSEIIKECKEMSPFCSGVYYILDINNILQEKESPMDNPAKWQHLIAHNKYIYF